MSTGEDVDEDKARGGLHNPLPKAAPRRSPACCTCMMPAVPLHSGKPEVCRTSVGAVVLPTV